ncbi:15581_t:CDS:2, partial [Racocetra fulgida]
NILIHKGVLKLADFGLSQRIVQSTRSRTTSKILGIVPYIDPECFMQEDDQDGISRRRRINKKSDVYSVGVLLWEISSERPPFEGYDLTTLPSRIIEGLREKPIPGTNERYIAIYERLNDIVNPFYKDLSYHDVPVSEIDISEFRDFFKEYVNTIFDEPLTVPPTPESHANEQDPKATFINELYLNFCNMFNKGMSVPRTIKKYISKNGKSESVVLNWLYLKNEPKYVCLRGIFYMWNIGTEEENKMDVFSLFLDAGNRNDAVAQYFIGRFFEVGWNTKKNLKKAVEWYNKAIKNGSTAAERILGDY